MGSLSGILQRPVLAASAVALASVSADLHDKLQPSKSSESCLSLEQPSSVHSAAIEEKKKSWVHHISASKLASVSFVTRIQVPVSHIQSPISTSSQSSFPSHFTSSASSPVLLNLYRTAALDRSANPATCVHPLPSSPHEGLYIWHLPKPSSIDVSGCSDCSSSKSRTLVILLGWLGAKQRHLKRYAEWYNSKGFHAVTYTFPLPEILSYQVGGKTEHDVELLVNHLADWLEEEHGKNLVFHTFSNTGWLIYGVILEKLQKQYPTLKERIKGCIVDSAPVAAADPQVWASGFSAAFLKKNSFATKGFVNLSEPHSETTVAARTVVDARPAVTEAALLLVLEKFFEVVLNLPTVNRRLSDVLNLLTSQQPSCPQLYIYSTADKVIPAGSVESFIEGQRRTGREVRACNFISTPHVDHFRNHPELYTSELAQFLEDCVLTCCSHSS
ncbi:PREDICTED: transmembrane protein 53 [Ipomoea nil]|uniref:transmembrane protein 53 n=1 Tax=Ipomoea nil TaxID=35883 RepID=UPI000900C494|nr:PREDICTED: transmembrane protein 53 [Ipomoea nil]XP_019186822.1 PREDICTED: transmembrane protein 53 [Ipomoea nil]XP_019186823.1 PREDICTED: transmembrane protein 53 [Ipomoea nil]